MAGRDVAQALLRIRWPLLSFAAMHILIFLLIFPSLYEQPHSSTDLYFTYASRIVDGQVPYRDFAVEYPPVALVFFLLPRLLASAPEAYATVFELQTLVWNLLGLLLLLSVCTRLRISPWRLAIVYTVALLSIGPIIAIRYDIFPAVMVLAALYGFLSYRPRFCWVLLALATLTKVYPVVLLPMFLVEDYVRRNYARMRSALCTYSLVILAVAVPLLVVTEGQVLEALTYHAGRGLHIESTYASLLIVAHHLGLVSIASEFSFGSWNLTGTVADGLAGLSAACMAVTVVALYGFMLRRSGVGSISVGDTVAWSVALIAAVIVTSKVFSPEYLIWLYPLVPLLFGRGCHAIWVLYIAIGVLTYYVYPLNYWDLVRLSPVVSTVLLIRNVMLLVLGIVAVRHRLICRAGCSPVVRQAGDITAGGLL